MNKDKMLQRVVVLTIAGLIAKVLSAVYRIPLENFVGDTGFYVYQQIYPIYGIGMTLALNGLPVFISKLIVEQPTLDEQKQLAGKLLRMLFIVGVGIFIALNLGAAWLASAMGDEQLRPVIEAVSWMFLLMPILSVGRGVAQGQLNMQATAISQVLEQLVRVTIIIVVAYIAMKNHWNVYVMGTLAMASAPIASMVASSLFVKPTGGYWHIAGQKNWFDKKLWNKLLTEGVLVSLMAALLIILQLVDSFTVQKGLVANGLTPMIAKASKGVYDRAQPIVQFSLVLATSFGTSLVPQMRQDFLKNQWETVLENAHILMKLTLWLASATTIGMIVLMPQINTLLFGNDDGSVSLSIYLLSAIALAVIIMLSSILQSVDQIKLLWGGILVAVISKIGLNLLLIKYFGLSGASWATVIALSLMVWSILLRLPPMLNDVKVRLLTVSVMVVNLLLMVLIVVGIEILINGWLPQGRLWMIPRLALGAIGGAMTLIVLTLKTKILTAQEIRLLPLGRKIIKWID